MFYKTLAIIALVAASGLSALAQSDVPVISGGVGFVGTSQGGVNFFEPITSPVIAVPLGDHFLVEGRATFLGFISRTDGTTGPYQAQFFYSEDYLQIDYTVNSQLTIVAGRFLTPFNMYNERFTPVWIPDLFDVPIIYSLSAHTNPANEGVMARGVLASTDKFEVNYAAFYSISNRTNDPNTHFGSARSAGGRAGVFFPGQRLELGASYQRYMQDTRLNIYGAYLSWQPTNTALDIKGEYTHSLSGSGYWLQGAYRLSRFRGPDSAIGRLAPVARVQQFFHNQPVASDPVPNVNVQQVDFGLNYYLPHEIRLNGSYGRQFTSQSNVNVWNFGVTYRFMFPAWPGGSK